MTSTTSAAVGATGSSDDVARAWATALALAWLRQNAAAVENEWRLLAGKASRCIDSIPAAPSGGSTWTGAARDFLDSK
ncbi:MAG: hypothetical protein H0W08_28165 [Acidobacteria bacterium]|nr:hypothetical protein [Acidobacteriota bacterium]